MEHVKNQKYAYLNNQVEKLAEKSHEMRTYIKDVHIYTESTAQPIGLHVGEVHLKIAQSSSRHHSHPI